MTVTDKQSADTSATAKSESDAKPDLDAALAQWDDDKEGPKKAEPESADRRIDAIEYRQEMATAIPRVKGDLDISDDMVEAFMNMKASRDKRLDRAYAERETNRAGWDKALDALHEDLKKATQGKGKKSDTKADKEGDKDDKGLAAAARMARESTSSGTGFDSVDWTNLSDQQFAIQKSKLFKAVANGEVR